MFRSRIYRWKLGNLYRGIPTDIFKQIVIRTDYFDRIGPIKIPSDLDDMVSDIYLYHFTFYRSKNQYVLISKSKNLHWNLLSIRISSNCFYGFIANSRRCDCRWQFEYALRQLKNTSDDTIILFCLDDHGKAIDGGLRGHALLYALGQIRKQELVKDAYELNGFNSDQRNYEDLHQIFAHLNIKDFNLLTNNPSRVDFFRMKGYVVRQITIEKPYDKYLSEELGVKKLKLGHALELPGFDKSDVEIYGLTKGVFGSD